MSRRLALTIGLAFLVLVTLAFLIAWAGRWLEAQAIETHQQSVTRELASWERDVTPIRNREEASHAVDLLRYVQEYYRRALENRGRAETAAAMEAQRSRTLRAIVATLEEYSGQHYGLDIERWAAWRKTPQNR